MAQKILPKAPKNSWSVGKIIATVVGLVILGFVGVVALSLSGGLQSFKNSIAKQPDPYSEKVQKKREGALSGADTEFTMLQNDNKGLKYFAASKHDRCFKGEANYKRQENYSNKCSVKMSRFYGTNDNLRNQIVTFSDFLAKSGWKDTGSTVGATDVQVALNRYDNEYGKKREGYMQYAGSIPPIINIKEKQTIRIEYVEDKPTGQKFDPYQTNTGGTGASFYEDEALQNMEVLYPRILKDHRYVIAVIIETIYFEN